MIPVVGTIVYWDEMSTPWKAVSIVTDFGSSAILKGVAG